MSKKRVRVITKVNIPTVSIDIAINNDLQKEMTEKNKSRSGIINESLLYRYKLEKLNLTLEDVYIMAVNLKQNGNR